MATSGQTTLVRWLVNLLTSALSHIFFKISDGFSKIFYFRPKKQRTGISAEPFNDRVIVNTDPKVKKPVHTKAFLLGIGLIITLLSFYEIFLNNIESYIDQIEKLR